MLDIETLSTAVNTVVLSIGAVEFDISNGKVLNEFYHELRLTDQDHRKIDIGTIQWWIKQVTENPTRAKTFDVAEKVPVRNALLLLRDFLGDDKKCIWACDPDFDCAILADLYKEYKLSTPWKYYEPKSVRTVREVGKLFGVEILAEDKSHNAYEDCVRQVKELVAILGGIQRVKVGA